MYFLKRNKKKEFMVCVLIVSGRVLCYKLYDR